MNLLIINKFIRKIAKKFPTIVNPYDPPPTLTLLQFPRITACESLKDAE